MIVLQDNFSSRLQFNTIIALGSFDGLHTGHLTLMNKTVEIAKRNNAKSMVFTFVNHPLTVIDKKRAPKLIMDNETKIELLEKLNIDITVFAEFNESFMKLLAKDFILNLIEVYNCTGIVVGFNHRFGYKNYGDIELLKKLSEQYGFTLYIENPITHNGDVISSTKIRNLLLEGYVEEANTMLLHPYMLKGKVIHGKNIGGKLLGFPTANLQYDDNFVIPKIGVYYTAVEVSKKLYKGITNVGTNPTIGENPITIETFILDFNNDIYDDKIKVYFIKKIREQVKFTSLDELKSQLYKDKSFAEKQILKI